MQNKQKLEKTEIDNIVNDIEKLLENSNKKKKELIEKQKKLIHMYNILFSEWSNTMKKLKKGTPSVFLIVNSNRPLNKKLILEKVEKIAKEKGIKKLVKQKNFFIFDKNIVPKKYDIKNNNYAVILITKIKKMLYSFFNEKKMFKIDILEVK